MKRLKNGFTIAEMLVCFTVIGLLASMLIPSIIYNKPNKNMAMFRKSYQLTERVVSEMIMDDETFPGEGDGAVSLAYYDTTPTRLEANTGKFFCETFAKKLNVNGEIRCDEEARGKVITDSGSNGQPIEEGKESFTTNDGIHWYITPSVICDPDFENECKLTTSSGGITCPSLTNKHEPFICVAFDVNGKEGPNKTVASKGATDVDRADRGWFYVYWNGKVVAPEGQAAKYLNTTTVLRD